MKRIKKVFSVLLCLVIASVMLTACSNGGNDNPAVNSTQATKEETTTALEQSSTESDMTQNNTEKQTQESAEPVTESVTEPIGDVIIPLYYSAKENEIRKVDPADFYDYSNFTMYFYPVMPAGKNHENGFELNKIKYGTRFVLSADPLVGETGTYDVDIYFYCGDLETMMYMMYYEVGDTNGVLDSFIPMWYNETKGCLVGYNRLNNDGVISYVLYEVYYSPIRGSLSRSQAVEDPSLYGF